MANRSHLRRTGSGWLLLILLMVTCLSGLEGSADRIQPSSGADSAGAHNSAPIAWFQNTANLNVNQAINDPKRSEDLDARASIGVEPQEAGSSDIPPEKPSILEASERLWRGFEASRTSFHLSHLRSTTPQAYSRRLLQAESRTSPVRQPLITIDDLPAVPIADCQQSTIASAFGGCEQGANKTCCPTIDLAFGPASQKSSKNCLCFSQVLAAAQDAGLSDITQILASCKSSFQLASSWAGQVDGSCPVLPSLNDPYLWRSLAPNIICIILCYVVVSMGMEGLLLKYSRPFRKLDIVKQRNVITYIWQILVTTCGLAITLAFGSELLARDKIGSVANYNNLRLSFLLITTLYVFELSYRIRTGPSLLSHHAVTLMLILLVTFSTYDTAPSVESKTWQRLGFLLSLHASTEQLTFLGLILYRAGNKHASLVLKITTWQFIVFKVLLHLAAFAIYIWGCVPTFKLPSASRSSTTWKWVWAYLFPISDFYLFLIQMWSAYILHKIAIKSGRSREAAREEPLHEEQPDKDLESPRVEA